MINKKFKGPTGRKNLPVQLLQFGKHLVYSEGTKTEPYYVTDIKNCISKKYNCQPNEITIISVNEDGKSYNTTGLVSYAKDNVEKRLKNKEKIDHVWIFFDKDDFPKEKFIEADRVINEMNDSNDNNIDGFTYNKETNISWHSCYSNEAFELWLLLYFNYCDSKLKRQDYIKKINEIKSLKAINFTYEKNLQAIHSTLVKNGGTLQNAIRNAKKLVTQNNMENPSTTVYLFAEFFKSYMNDE